MSEGTTTAGEPPESAEGDAPPTPLPKWKIRRPEDVTGSTEARRLAAMVLEVLAGLRTPTEAARALEVSQTYYYNIEARALQGVVNALEPRPPGKKPDLGAKIASLEKENARLAGELARTQGLVRMARRAIGISGAEEEEARAKAKKKGAKKPARARRRPTVRAQRAAKRLLDTARSPSPATGDEEAVSPEAPDEAR